jgi:vacuolar-type H+-ATPase subunit I/STV1
MNADLNLIFYETEFLKESNANLREECTRLFKDYCKIIDYDKSLDETRKDDNWESVYDNLNVYIENLESHASGSLEDPSAQKALTKGIANLEFSIHRLLDFLNQYSAFITQGEQYYQKFDVIVSNYQNEEKCASQLPHQFEVLKKDISISIDKFDEAYNVAELKGSKLKDLLFGEED